MKTHKVVWEELKDDIDKQVDEFIFNTTNKELSEKLKSHIETLCLTIFQDAFIRGYNVGRTGETDGKQEGI